MPRVKTFRKKKLQFFVRFFLTDLQAVKRFPGSRPKKKSKKNLDNKATLPYCLTMQNEFALISAESDLRDMIVLSPMEIAEANAWFDMVSAQFDEIEAAWDRLAEYVDNL